MLIIGVQLLTFSCIIRTLGEGLLCEDKGDSQIFGYCDTNCPGSLIDKNSATGYCVSIAGNIITKEQEAVCSGQV